MEFSNDILKNQEFDQEALGAAAAAGADRTLLPLPLFDRILREYLKMRAIVKESVFPETFWRATVHTDHGQGFISRMKYAGLIHEDEDGRMHLPYDIKPDLDEDDDSDGEDDENNNNALVDGDGAGSGERSEDGQDIVMKEMVIWDAHKLIFDMCFGQTDMATTA